MAKRRRGIDKGRASRDGHEFHEAWTARKATQLLWPDSDLTAIAVEGPSPEDQARVSSQTVEIADLTFYFGDGKTFDQAKKTTIAQFKYSIADKDKDFRATNAKKTVEKFGIAYREYKSKYGAKNVQQKLDFQLVTNQPIYESLIQAIDALATNSVCKGNAEKQAIQFQKASGLKGKPLADFAKKVKLIGRSGSLPQEKKDLASLLVDWSATNDPIASARLGELRNLVREKAGYAGTDQNLITRTDILAALKIGDPTDLLPCESALADVGQILERNQLAEALTRVEDTFSPLLIHAAGGVGKTVFMDTLASKLSKDHEIVFFDCFGGGAYRSPEDARHLPKKGLIHIANTLAFRGLCDPILPDSSDIQTLLRTFRRRLTQSVETFSRMTPGRELAIFIDAIDNAEFAARQGSEDCFPIKLLESLDTEPVSGVKLIVSCRTERKPATYAKYEELSLNPFSKDETESFLRTRLKNVSEAEVNVAQSRSRGNPRVLEYLLKTGRGLLDESEIDKRLELDDLIQNRITDALGAAMNRGYSEDEIEAFLAGLAVLPPPVPLEEYAGAHGLEICAIESFASDLNPLLEWTRQGLMFRDEPTETFVHDRYASSLDALRRVATNLNDRQDISVYAARALPRLLHELDDGEKLLSLAFDERIPSSITSTVGKRNVRYARLKAAALHAALKKNYNNLVQLLMELSTIAAVDQKGVDYILNHPDLVVAAQDSDSARRLFEVKTSWPGTRHARLTIANTLYGESEEAYRHAYAESEWIEHHRRTRKDDGLREPGPERLDIAAIPFFLISQGRGKNAANYLKGWLDWYVYQVCEFVFDYTHLAHSITSQPERRIGVFLNEISGIGALTAALSFQNLSRQKTKELTIKLAKRCKNTTKLDLPNSYHRERSSDIRDGLRKSAAVALSLGLLNEAMTISLRAPHPRPSLWALRDAFYSHDIFVYIFRVALRVAAKNQVIHEKDMLPKELVPICSRIGRNISGEEFLKKAKIRISNYVRSSKEGDNEEKNTKPISYEDSQNAERYLSQRLEPLLNLTKAFSSVLGASSRTLDKSFLALIEVWNSSSKNKDPYRSDSVDHFFRMLGLEVALFCLWSRSDLKPDAVKHFLSETHKQGIGAPDLVRVVTILAKRDSLQAIAGEQAIKARELIEREDDVSYRASLFGELARAILPANINEGTVYFRLGLEQMDAIGSGDYQFTNELLLFASQLKGEELEERDFHTLSNICELNMGEEPEKFFWGAYGRGLSKVAGIRGLAKLSRWDDRSKISLSNTLLPYLTGLLEYGKIEPKDALALNRLANPVEYFNSGTKEFAEALHQQAGPDPALIKELINQYQDDNPSLGMDNTVGVLGALAEETLADASEISNFLASAGKHYKEVRNAKNERSNHRSNADLKMRQRVEERDSNNEVSLNSIAAATTPTDESSLTKAIDDFNALGNMYELKSGFFEALRHKVPYGDREQYIQNIAELENLFFYWKFAELNETKQAWASSSASLEDVFSSLAVPIINTHAADLIDHGNLSGSNIKEISDLTGVPMAELILELIKIFARPDSSVSGTVWLGFATFICSEADEGQGQIALTRLLSSEASRLADNVVDGTWINGLYPEDDFNLVATEFIWRVLGSPYAIDRWRGAHCVRSFAKIGRWEILEKLVGKFGQTRAGAFQARELPFFHMHARLWLLIALARMAVDNPAKISRYKNELLTFILEDNSPHVLMRHFAAQALLSCVEGGDLKLSVKQLGRVKKADLSPYRRVKKKERIGGGIYSKRPASEPEPSFEFHLDYDFNKQDVDYLSQVFGLPHWKVTDLMSEIVHSIAPGVESMYETSGRESPNRRSSYGLSSRYNTHGQQLGWHALFFTAGKLLMTYPVTDDWWYEDDPWGEWLSRYILTRNDGLWLSDGTDRTPLDASEFLLERKKKELVITGDAEKLLKLAGLGSRVRKELVIEGQWYSADDIRVNISSALVPPAKANKFAQKLTREEPMIVWVPCFYDGEDDSEYLRSEKNEYVPWVVCPSGEARIDEHDPYGITSANLRPRLARDFAFYCSLSKDDPFGRIWKDKQSREALRAQVWGREDGSHSGMRLFCSSSILKRILKKYDKDLLILINLERYEKETYRGDSKYTHTVAVARITKTLDIEYFKGRVNHLYKERF